MIVRLLAALLILAGLAPSPAPAHEASIAVMSLTEFQPGRYTFRWDVRPLDERIAALRPTLPGHCRFEDPVAECGAEGLVGQVGFPALGQAQSAAMLSVRALGGATQVVTLTPAKPTARIAPAFEADSWAGRLQILQAYLAIGVEHILAGVDHLMFVFGLMWLSRGRWELVKTITAFTVAHSITLGAVTFGLIGVPEAFVNAMIALSIVFVGIEVLKREAGQTSFTLRNPWAVAFGFGLLHGFGFANALVELGLPEDAVPLALLAFNLGVEVGQLGFVGLVLALGWALRVMTVPAPARRAAVAAYAIGGLASFWFVGRVVGMLSA